QGQARSPACGPCPARRPGGLARPCSSYKVSGGARANELVGTGEFYADNAIVTSVPEPSTLALAAIGGVGLVVALRRRKRALAARRPRWSIDKPPVLSRGLLHAPFRTRCRPKPNNQDTSRKVAAPISPKGRKAKKRRPERAD